MAYYSDSFNAVMSKFDQFADADGSFRLAVAQLDKLWNDSEVKLFGKAEEITSPDCFIFRKQGVRVENIFKTIMEKMNVKADYTLYRYAMKIAKEYNEIDVNSVFVGTLEINEKAFYHEYYLSRAREETISYGTLALFDWYNLFCSASGGKWVELQYIAGLVNKALPNPIFVIRKKDFSDLKHVSLFYNIVNIVESLLNLSEIRMSLTRDGTVIINNKKFSLHDILDELALKICVDPKNRMQKLRLALNCTVRFAGVDTDRPDYLRHVGANPSNHTPRSRLEYTKYDVKLTEKFRNTEYVSNNFKTANEIFDSLNLIKLKNLANEIMRFEFVDENMVVKTNPRDLSIACSFMLNIVKIPGYGRASKYATAPRSKEEKPNHDYGGIADTFEQNIMNIHREAVNDFSITTNGNLIHRFLGFLKTTSSGMKPVDVEVTIEDGQGQKSTTKVKAKKKLLTAALYGENLLSRNMLDIKMDKSNPGRTGTRDVPGKQTRAIYPIPLSTLGAMIVPSYHIVKYVSTAKGNTPFYGRSITSDYISSGSEATTGIRISDNLNTISASGLDDYICIDIDMSNFDSCCIGKNFRKPFMKALKRIGVEEKITEVYGGDELSWDEMVDFGFGEGYLSHTYWDAGRKPIIVLKDEFIDAAFEIGKKVKLERITVGDDNMALRPVSGCIKLKVGESYFVAAQSNIPNEYQDCFYLGYVRDGSDLLFLTSEASGELTTLAMNSIMNLSIQQKLIEDLKKTKFGKCLDVKTHQAIGDDITILCRIVSFDFESKDIDDFLLRIDELISSYGFEISLNKTFLCYGQSEYVQTYAIRGLFIPKDQILLVSSERPRRITDPLAYLESFKRLLCTKISRGMSHRAAEVIYLYTYRRLMTVDLRRHKVQMNNNIAFMCGGVNVFMKDIRVTRNNGNSFGSMEDMHRFVPSIARAFLPKSAGGGGLFLHAMNIVVTDSLFIYNLERFKNVKTKNYMYSLYCFFKTRYKMKPLTESSNVKVSFGEHKLFSLESLFGKESVRKLEIIKNFVDLGRLNGENVPFNLVRKGISMEHFMINVNFSEEEYETEKYVKSLSKGQARWEPKEDQVLLNFEFEFTAVEKKHLGSFIEGIENRYQHVLEALGIKTEKRMRQSKVDQIRRILFSDPVMNLVHGPETIISVLEENNITEPSDMPVGLLLLQRMGVQENTRDRIINIYIDLDTTHFCDDTIGACTDDLSSLMDWLTEENYSNFTVPPKISPSMKYRVYILGLQLSMLNFLSDTTKPFLLPVRANLRSREDSKKLRKTFFAPVIGFPRLSEFENKHLKRKNVLSSYSAVVFDCIT